MPGVKYKWDPNSRVKRKGSVESLGKEFEKLRKKDSKGLLKPEAVVKAAKDGNPVLAGYFDFEDVEKAANEYWLIRARWLIAAVVVVRVGDTKPSRHYVSVVKDGNRGYTTVPRATGSQVMKKTMFEDVLNHMIGLRQTYAHVTEMQPVWDALDRVIDGL